jgi:hypothetical protein
VVAAHRALIPNVRFWNQIDTDFLIAAKQLQGWEMMWIFPRVPAAREEKRCARSCSGKTKRTAKKLLEKMAKQQPKKFLLAIQKERVQEWSLLLSE